MASNNNLYDWPFRYLVGYEDMMNQQEVLLNNPNAMMEGMLYGSVLKGFEAATGGAMTLSIAAGIAVSPSGYLHNVTTITNITPTAPVGSPARSLIVARPNLVPNDLIADPSNPVATVYLRTREESVVTLLPGTPGTTPTYPSVEDNDVILVGVRTYPGQTVIALEDLDFTVRENIGSKSAFLQNSDQFDDRLRPFRSTNQIVGIRPSQLVGGNQRQFTGGLGNIGAIYPKTPGGVFNANNSFYNFQTGAVTGGDGASSAFSPTIPSTGNAINATITLTTSNTIAVSYGTQGTRAQCFAGIVSQVLAGAGSVNPPSSGRLIAYVTVYSNNGTAVTEIDICDARGINGFVNPMMAIGDLISGGTSGAPERVAANITVQRKFLREKGTGAAGAAPTLENISSGDISGVLAAQATAHTLTYESPQDFIITNPASAITQALPSANVLAGQKYRMIVNGATVTNTVTLQSSGANTIDLIKGTGSILVMALQDTPTTAAHWKVLDLYDEGAWTPTYSGSGGSAGSASYSSNGSYVRKMKSINVQGFVLQTGSVGSWTGVVQIGALPFASRATFNAGGSIGQIINLTTAIVSAGILLNAGTSLFTMTKRTAAAVSSTDIGIADWASTTRVDFSLAYEAA